MDAKIQKSGKCQIRAKIRIRDKNPDPEFRKFFFDFLYFSIVNNFCKISFFLKRLFTQKKYVFCIFHVLQLPPANRETDVVLFYNIKIKMALSFTSSKSPQFFFPGKNQIRKFRGESRYQIPDFYGHILRIDTINYIYIPK